MPDPTRWNAAAHPWPLPSRITHWGSALVVAGALLLAFTQDLPDSSATSRELLAWHQRLGLFAALLLCLRLAFRRSGAVRSGPIDRSTPLGRALQTGAALSHALLYVLLAAIPALGWAMTSARGRDVALLPGTPALPHLVATDPDLADTLQTWHERAAWLLMALVALHVAAALWHHSVQRDEVLTRMWPALARRSPRQKEKR